MFAVSELCCPKEHARSSECAYQVAWSINPHMRVGQVSWRRAAAQHRALKAALTEAGARLLPLPFVHGAFDSVFAKDSALLAHHRGQGMALLAAMRHPERRGELVARARALEARGFEVMESPPVYLEGGDVQVLRGAVLMGHGLRTSRRAAGVLEAFFELPVTPLELRDPHLYHLDTALTVLEDGTALVCREAFTEESLAALERTRGVREVVAVPREEALGFGLNLVQVGRTVVVGGSAPTVEAALRERGYAPVVVPLEQFHLAGGSAACLVARVHPAVQAGAHPNLSRVEGAEPLFA